MRLGRGVLATVMVLATAAHAQIAIPQAEAPDGSRLFRNQCATCHTLRASEGPRQGPNLEHVYGRKIGSVDGYKYTAGYRESSEVWSEANLDKYLTNPAAMFPGSTMAYRQPNAGTRKAIIDFLKDQG